MLDVKTLLEVTRIVEERFGKNRMTSETIQVQAGLQHFLTQDITTDEFVPNFNRSTVDGYAVVSSDVFGCSDAIPALLNLAGESLMGEHNRMQVSKGHCAYVPTGGEVPEGADAMVMLEYAEDMGDGTIAIYKPCAPGANMIFRGDDVKPGDVVIPAGTRLGASQIGALAAMGVTDIQVAMSPRVAIISTGDELVPLGTELTLGKIRDVNQPMLSAAVLQAGGNPVSYGIIRDDKEAIKMTMAEAIRENDMLLITGGTSVGVKDAIPDAISELGELIVHGVAAKPGKPTILGMIEGKPVFGLPGNPVAAYFMFHMLARPLLYVMMGAETIEHSLKRPISRAVSSNHGREEFVPIVLEAGAARPVASKSGLITTLSCADGYIRIPRDCEGIRQGEIVDVILFTKE